MSAIVEACEVCARIERAADELYGDDRWSALGSPQRPGWVTLALRRHSDWSFDLADDEAAGLGSVLRRVSGLVRDVMGVERVYVLGFGEQTQHFHVMLLPRPLELHADIRTALAAVGPTNTDPARAVDVNRRLREASAAV